MTLRVSLRGIPLEDISRQVSPDKKQRSIKATYGAYGQSQRKRTPQNSRRNVAER